MVSPILLAAWLNVLQLFHTKVLGATAGKGFRSIIHNYGIEIT